MDKQNYRPCRLCKGTGEAPDGMGKGLCPRCWGRAIVPRVLRYSPAVASGEMAAHKDGLWVRYEDFQQAMELFPPKVWVTFKGPLHREFAGVHVARPAEGAPQLVTLQGGGSDESTGTHEGDYWRDQWEAADADVTRYSEENAKLERDLQTWREAEHEARQGIPECTLCPHLGCGDPLVDIQAKEHETMETALRRIQQEVAHALDSLRKERP